MMDVSIVIVSWNTRHQLACCLDSIRSNPPPGTYEVWVVDNASSDGSPSMLRERYPWVRLVESGENKGFAAGNNQALYRAAGRYALLLNSDTELRPGACAALLAFMQGRPEAGAAGARLLNTDGSLQPSCYPMLSPGREFWRLMFLDPLWRRSTYPMQRWDATAPRRVDAIKGACLMLRRQALEEVGLFDERYFMYTEEFDLCYRLAMAGWERWWVPQAEVVHHEAQSTRQAAESMYVQLYRSKVQFWCKFAGERQAGRFKRLLAVAYWPRFAVTAIGGRVSPGLAVRSRTYRRLLAELREM